MVWTNMAARVKLAEVVDALGNVSEEVYAYLNRDTGEIVTVTRKQAALAGDEAVDPNEPEAAQHSALEEVRQAIQSDRYVVLPGAAEIGEWELMKRFAYARPTDRQRLELLNAIQGRRASRRFQRAIARLDIEQEWHVYRRAALQDVARAWLESMGIDYE